MNRTPAHRLFSFATGLAFVFAAGAFAALPFFSHANQAYAQFGNGSEEGFYSDETPETSTQSYTRGDAQLEIEAIRKYKEGLESDNSNLNRYQFDSLNATAATLYCEIVGDCIENQNGNSIVSNGIIPGLGQGIALMYENPPASTHQYVAYILDSAGINIAQPAYAQVGGLGFSSLEPILNTWVRMRNVAYLFFVIMFVVIGFMIMFRQKIGGQTVVTIQQAVPQIIISLIAVTFSFAIAGLLIDFMYISMFLLLAIFGKTPETTAYFNGSILAIAAEVMLRGAESVNASISEIIKSIFGDNFLTTIFGGAIGIGGALVFALVMAARMFQLFFSLVQTYVSIIISIVTAPIPLMLGAIPGKNNLVTWIKGLVGNLAAFPTVLFVLLLFESLTENANRSYNGSGFIPPYLVGNGSAEAVTNIIAIGLIIILPTIVEEAKKALGAGDGVFGQFGKAMLASVKDMYNGTPIIPGIGFTNPANYGLSGKNMMQKGAIGTAAAGFGGARFAGGFINAVPQAAINVARGRGFKSNATPILGGVKQAYRGARYAADALGDKRFKKDRDARKAGKKSYTDDNFLEP